MKYLKLFGLENFKVFKEKTGLEFAPITVLTERTVTVRAVLFQQ